MKIMISLFTLFLMNLSIADTSNYLSSELEPGDYYCVDTETDGVNYYVTLKNEGKIQKAILTKFENKGAYVCTDFCRNLYGDVLPVAFPYKKTTSGPWGIMFEIKTGRSWNLKYRRILFSKPVDYNRIPGIISSYINDESLYITSMCKKL